MTEPTIEGKLETVRKLLAKAERASTVEEADAFTAKAMQLMARHGIDEAMLAASGRSKDGLGMMKFTIRNPYSQAKGMLLGNIADAMRCKTVLHPDYTRRSTGSASIFGWESDLRRVELLYTSLLLQAAPQVARQFPGVFDEVSVATFRKNWFRGFAVEIWRRLSHLEKTAADESTAVTDDGTSTALVLIDRTAQLDNFYNDFFFGVKLGEGKKIVLGAGAHEGAMAGRRANLGENTSVNDANVRVKIG